jgi:hypothetical protein
MVQEQCWQPVREPVSCLQSAQGLPSQEVELCQAEVRAEHELPPLLRLPLLLPPSLGRCRHRRAKIAVEEEQSQREPGLQDVASAPRFSTDGVLLPEVRRMFSSIGVFLDFLHVRLAHEVFGPPAECDQS